MRPCGGGIVAALRSRRHDVIPASLTSQLYRTSAYELRLSRRGLLTDSYTRGPATPPLLELTVGEHFAKVVSEYGDRTAVISKHQRDRLSYASLDHRSNSLARGLASVGVKKGDRVGVMLGNSVEYAMTIHALVKLGAILVPLNPSFNAAQVISALAHLESSHLIISSESNLPRKDPRSNLPLIDQLIDDVSTSKLESSSVPSLKRVIVVDNSAGRVDTRLYKNLTPFNSLVSNLVADSRSLPSQDLSPDEIINIQFTSGTTAMPKAACLSHRSILNNGAQIGDRMLLTPGDVVCCPPPLFHCFGLILGFMATATHGSAIVFPSESFNAKAALSAVQEEKCTALYGVPTMFLEELSLIESGEVSSDGFQFLRTGIAAGSSIPAELMKKLHKVLNLTELTICYGMTETSPVSAMTTTDDPLEKRINTVGRLMPHVEAKIVDPVDKSQILPVETRGELAVSGYLLMKEYWNEPNRTAEAMIPDAEGKTWMHTGDEATISADGYVTITGRIKDLIIRGGENIHPLEIENCLLGMPEINDVSIVGVPDQRYGEVAAAFVIARDHTYSPLTPEKIQYWVREKLSNHLAPKYVFFLAPGESFPKTASGKIQKFKLREEAIRLIAKDTKKSE
ncbi:AMP-dependent synthetase/ligase domain-containing protein [Penicillium ucsense]|uniref:AMP-dependent synthetase/ligase domain-containing protein n=1 Tax=Penicillium ucsense TaxID=2839758 RepID=A0A8J8WB79_9EURO|nr:AMP-dependent synthetase/ligase domain-containing protein [Penicillium ucsense]KAF7736044.1 AMP-dependent synthetase/ligase domain-containing protein [Penicillium ucsense]